MSFQQFHFHISNLAAPYSLYKCIYSICEYPLSSTTQKQHIWFLCFSHPVFNSHSRAGTRESPRPKAGTHGRDTPAPPLPPPPPPPPPLLRERSERAEAREHVREQQAIASGRSSANGLPPRRAAEELRKQVLCGQRLPVGISIR